MYNISEKKGSKMRTRKLVTQIEQLIRSEKITTLEPSQRFKVSRIVEVMSKEERADLSAMIDSDWAKSVSVSDVLFNVFHDIHMFDEKYFNRYDHDRFGVPRSKRYRKRMQNKQKIN